MTKKATIKTITAGHASNTQLNFNFEAINDKLDNTLSLDGSTPNAMGADLDMDSNDILNAANVHVDALTIGGVQAVPTGIDSIAGDLTIGGDIIVSGIVDGRDVAADGIKLDGIEALADVTDTVNVTAAGALMDSELADITAVKILTGANTGDEVTATTTTSGIVEKATSAEGVTPVADKFPDVVVVAEMIAALGFIVPTFMHVRDEKTVGTAGGTSATGLNTRILNTVGFNSITGASLASNKVTLPAGTYKMRGRAPGSNSDRHKAYLYDVTGSAIVIAGNTNQSDDATNQGDSNLIGMVVLTITSDLEVRHDFGTSGATTGLGYAAGVAAAGVEVYTELWIEKVA